jgi:hypothetical protein
MSVGGNCGNRGSMLDRYLMQKYKDQRLQPVIIADSEV